MEQSQPLRYSQGGLRSAMRLLLFCKDAFALIIAHSANRFAVTCSVRKFWYTGFGPQVGRLLLLEGR